MRVDGNGGGHPNYFPNSFDNTVPDESYKEPAYTVDSNVVDWFDRNGAGENDHFTQPGIFYRQVLSEGEKKALISNIVGSMSGISGPKREEIINRQLCHFFRVLISDWEWLSHKDWA